MWAIIDSRTGRRAGTAVYLSQRGAELQVLAWRDRERAGRIRLDIPFALVQALRAIPLH